MRTFLRILALVAALPLLGIGGGLLAVRLGGDDLIASIEDELIERLETAEDQAPGAGKPYEQMLDQLDSLSESLDTVTAPPVWGGALGAAFLLLLFSVWPASRRGRKGRATPAKAKAPAESLKAAPKANDAPELSRREIKKAMKTAAGLEGRESPEAAGEYLIGVGLRDEAGDLFLAAGLLERAAEMRHDRNRFEESAELFEKAGKHESAGAIFAQLERFADAARCYKAAEKRSVAGEMFEKAELFTEAGECYREIGFHRYAARAFLQAGSEAAAAESLVEAFVEEGGDAPDTNHSKHKELRNLGRKAGELFVKLERLAEAEDILVRCGAFSEAARIAMKAGAFDRSAELFQKIGRGDLAAEALERAGDKQGAARIKGEFLRGQGDEEAAAELLREAGEFQEAGDLFRRFERYKEAAECYREAHDNAAAAEMFRVAEAHQDASEAYESCGNFEAAAESVALTGDLARYARLLERAGKHFEAGEAFAEQGDEDEAIRLLQSVAADDPNFLDASALLGKLFEKKGMLTLSKNKLEQATGDDPVSKENVEAYYTLGRILEKRNEAERAAEIFERILSFDYHYRDVEAALEHAKAAARSANLAPTAAGGAATPAPQPAAGRYQLVRELGRGGMGVVFLARDTTLDREVAYKVLPEGLRENPTALKKFLREAKAAAQLNHRHIVTVYDAGESEQGFYLAMEYVDGTTLKDLLSKKGAISPGGVLYVLRQMAEALDYAHGRKVVHRDIKTANTMWTRDRQVKIMDFGLAKLMEEVRNATTMVSGTPFYMSPEQTLGRDVDHRTDLYSLGVTIFELATGELPFKKGNVPYHHVHTAPPRPRELNDKIPEALEQIILRCLEKDPEQRFSSARAILDEMERIGARAPQS